MNNDTVTIQCYQKLGIVSKIHSSLGEIATLFELKVMSVALLHIAGHLPDAVPQNLFSIKM